MLFAAPKDSVIDIVQAAGRPLRLSGEADAAAIIVPAVLSGDEGTGRAGRWENVVRVVRALAAHDDRLTASLTAVRAIRPAPGYGSDHELPASIVVKAGPGAAARLVDALRVRIINATTSSWWDWHALLRDYRREHGHVYVPASHRAPGGQRLGKWLDWQRSEHARGALAADRAAALGTSVPAGTCTTQPSTAAWSTWTPTSKPTATRASPPLTPPPTGTGWAPGWPARVGAATTPAPTTPRSPVPRSQRSTPEA